MRDYQYGFNGKEKEQSGEWGRLTYYDYGMRIYNPGIGRFLSVDPLAAKYASVSPYTYVLDNPISLLDPDGREVIAPNKASKQSVLQSMSYMFGKSHGFSFSGNKLIHSGTVPFGLSKGQSLMFSYFYNALVTYNSGTTVRTRRKRC